MQHLSYVIDGLIEESLCRLRAVADEIFVKEFILEAGKRDALSVSLNHAMRRFFLNLRTMFGAQALESSLEGPIKELALEGQLLWRTICRVLATAEEGREVGKSFPREHEETVGCLNSIAHKLQVAKEKLLDSLAKGEESATFDINGTQE